MYKLKIICQSDLEIYQKLKKNSDEIKLETEREYLTEEKAIEIAMNENRIVAYNWGYSPFNIGLILLLCMELLFLEFDC